MKFVVSIDERVAVPARARIAVQQPDLRRQVRRAVHRNRPDDPLALAGVVIDADRARRLDDARDRAIDRHRGAETPFGILAIFRAVRTIHARDVVERRRLFAARRDRPGFAARRALEQRLEVLAHGGRPRLRLGRHRRDFSVLGIDDERRPSVGELGRRRQPVLVVGLRDVLLGSLFRPVVASRARRDVFFDRFGFCRRQHRLTRELRRPLERRERLAAPDALQIRLAPRRLRRRVRRGPLRDEHRSPTSTGSAMVATASAMRRALMASSGWIVDRVHEGVNGVHGAGCAVVGFQPDAIILAVHARARGSAVRQRLVDGHGAGRKDRRGPCVHRRAGAARAGHLRRAVCTVPWSQRWPEGWGLRSPARIFSARGTSGR